MKRLNRTSSSASWSKQLVKVSVNVRVPNNLPVCSRGIVKLNSIKIYQSSRGTRWKETKETNHCCKRGDEKTKHRSQIRDWKILFANRTPWGSMVIIRYNKINPKKQLDLIPWRIFCFWLIWSAICWKWFTMVEVSLWIWLTVTWSSVLCSTNQLAQSCNAWRWGRVANNSSSKS